MNLYGKRSKFCFKPSRLLLTASLLVQSVLLSETAVAENSGEGTAYSIEANRRKGSDISVVDGDGNRLILNQPARRIVSLAPHITEMLFSAGAAQQIVGTVAFSDYPITAERIPRVGDSVNLDLEAIAALQPDLVVAWNSGNPSAAIQAVKQLGFPVYLSEPDGFKGIADEISDLGRLSGHTDFAREQIRQFLGQLGELESRYHNKMKVSVFYQIWQEPLMTVNGEHIINQVIELCGGVNPFAEILALAPQVTLESVFEKNAQVILISSPPGGNEQLLAYWRRWPNLQAVSNQAIYPIPWDLISRHSLRIAEGAKAVCEAIELARQKVIADDKTPSHSN